MKKAVNDISLFLYLCVVTLLAVLIIIINALFNLNLPFSVYFLIAYVGSLLIFVITHAIITKGLKKSIIFISLSFVIAFTAEALGVNFGLIFGHYYYTDALGVDIFGVPLLAALAWEPIIYAAFSITDILSPAFSDKSKSWLSRLPANLWMAVVGALATTAWDMMIDPIAVNEGWWVWSDGGSYASEVANGVPVSNFLGWLGVSFVIQFIYRFISGVPPATEKKTIFLSLYGPILLYSSLFLTSIGVTMTILKNPEVAIIGLLAMAPFIAISLTNINLIQNGLSILLGTEWIDKELSEEQVKIQHL